MYVFPQESCSIENRHKAGTHHPFITSLNLEYPSFWAC